LNQGLVGARFLRLRYEISLKKKFIVRVGKDGSGSEREREREREKVITK